MSEKALQGWFEEVTTELTQYFVSSSKTPGKEGLTYRDGYRVGLIDALAIVKKNVQGATKKMEA